MIRTQVSAVALALGTLLAGQAMAADEAAVTRAQVQAELAEWVRNGNESVGEAGIRLNELLPHLYPAQQTPSAATREQVQQELSESNRKGEVTVGEVGIKLNELHPQLYPIQR